MGTAGRRSPFLLRGGAVVKEKRKKRDFLLDIFLAATVVDTVIISILVLILSTMLAVAVFMAMGLFLLWTGALVFQMLLYIVRLRFYTAAGFLGAGIFAMGAALLMFTLFVRLVKAYPDVIRFFKHFLLLATPDKESLSGQVLRTVRKFRPYIFIILIVLGLGCLILSGLFGGLSPVVTFIQRNFSFKGLFTVYKRMLGR